MIDILNNLCLAPAKEFDAAKLVLDFNGFSASVKLLTPFGGKVVSEMCLWEDSEYIEVNSSGHLTKISMHVSTKNRLIKPSFLRLEGKYKLLSNTQDFFIFPKTCYRYYSTKNDTLFCFNRKDFSCAVSLYKINDYFSLAFANNIYAGYLIDSPIIFLCNMHNNGMYQKYEEYIYIDNKTNPSLQEKTIFSKLLAIVSEDIYEGSNELRRYAIEKLYKLRDKDTCSINNHHRNSYFYSLITVALEAILDID